jgi:hypothetical protein
MIEPRYRGRTVEVVLTNLISRLSAAERDQVLKNMIYALYSNHYRFDLPSVEPTNCPGSIEFSLAANHLRRAIWPGPAAAGKPRLMATFRPQKWVNDNAVDVVDGAVEFDATVPFLSFSNDEIRNFKEHDYASDHLAASLPEFRQHGGPFEVDVDVDEWLRTLNYPGRKHLTDEQIRELRQTFEVEQTI